MQAIDPRYSRESIDDHGLTNYGTSLTIAVNLMENGAVEYRYNSSNCASKRNREKPFLRAGFEPATYG